MRNGGTIYNASTAGVLTVYDSTFYSNTGGSSPASTGGSIGNLGTTFSVTNSIFANPTPSGNECTSVTVLVGTGCPASPQTTPDVNGDLQDTAANLKLSSLSNFGGLTATLVPGTGSAAICGGTAPAKNVDGSQLTTDQRGFPTDPNCGVNVDSGSVQVGSNTITVTTTTDDAGTPAGNAANCPGVACSLRDAIAKANGLGSANIDATGISGTIALGAKLPLSTGNTTIAGPGAGNLTVDGGAIPGGDAILENTAGSLTVSDMTFANAAHTGNGGGLIDAATMSLTRVTLKHNSSTGDGGGVYSTGTSTLTVDQSTFTNNTATGGGGGIESASGALTVTNSTFSGNSTAGNGSAIDDTGSSTPTIDYSTFSGNNATGGTGGGAIALYSGGAITITNATFAGNANAGGPDDTGIFNSGGALTVKNSLLDVALECSVGTGCPTNGTNGNIVAPTNSNAGMTGMSALGSYGGATQTILPEPGSNAICGGLLASIPSGFTTDQRGLSNATPGGYGVANCSDAGSVQTNYTAVGFNAGSYTASVNIAGATPQVIASVTENGQNVGGIPLTLTTGGAAGTPTGTTATTVGGTGATFSALTFPATGIGTVEETFTVVGADVLTAGPLNVTVGAAGNVATTTTEATPAPASFVVSVTATNVTLAATVVHTATPVTEGNVTFTVHSGSAAGPVIGTAVGPIAVNGSGATGNVTYVIPANQAAATYFVVAAYSDPGGPGNFQVSNDSTKTIVINPAVTATQSIASKVLTQNQPSANFTPVTGSGGVAPLAYSIAPALPTGLTISGTTGAITGSPSVALAAAVFTVTVKDANLNQATNTFTLTVNSAVTATQSIATVTLTQGHLATPFTPVTGGGGTAPLGYTIAPALPTGLTISASTGQITGTPTVALTATTFTVTVTDANLATQTNTFSLTVNGTLTAVQSVAAVTFTNGKLITPVTPITATGGTTPLTFAVAPALPTGLTFSTTTGQITGTPGAVHATSTFTVTITDANSSTANNTFTLTVNAAVTATQAIASTVLTQNHVATAFTPVNGGGGTAPLTYSVLPALPAGLTMAPATGQITGTPTVASIATAYTVTVTDANAATATATFSLTVNGAVTATQAVPTIALTINHAAVPVTPVTGAGGTAPLTYGVAPALPTGLTMAPATGQITGTPTVASVATTYTVTVTDANSATATATFSLAVNIAVTATQAVASTVLTQNHAATAFTPVTGGGGTTPLTYSVLPVLPTGLTMSGTTGAITGTPTVTLHCHYFHCDGDGREWRDGHQHFQPDCESGGDGDAGHCEHGSHPEPCSHTVYSGDWWRRHNAAGIQRPAGSASGPDDVHDDGPDYRYADGGQRSDYLYGDRHRREYRDGDCDIQLDGECRRCCNAGGSVDYAHP